MEESNIKYNKLLADFMQANYRHKYGFADQMGYEYLPNQIGYYCEDRDKNVKIWFSESHLRYHVSWDWLIPVIAKFDDVRFEDKEKNKNCQLWCDAIDSCIQIYDIDLLFPTVVQAIEWYNTVI